MSVSSVVKDDADRQMRVGTAVRELRRRQNMTLQTLGDAAGLSVGFLSQVERAIATPSLSAMANIARALGVELDYFVVSTDHSETCTRANERERYRVGDSPVTYERMNARFPGATLSAFLVTVPAHYEAELVSHEGEDFVLQISGQLEYIIDGTSHVLNVGDSLHFPSSLPHMLRNPNASPAQYSWIGTEPALRQRFNLKRVEDV
jgi:transcriptional regulator with XRE-family HTH domain